MIEDVQTLFSDNQAVTVTANSTNVYDLQVARNISRGREFRFKSQVLTTFTAGGSATLDVALVAADDTALTSNVETLHKVSGVAVASLVAGYTIMDKVLSQSSPSHRYLGVIYTVATGPMTAGKLQSGIVLDTDDAYSYPQFAGSRSAFTS